MVLSGAFFALLALISTAWSACYYPDGTALLDPDYQPCNSTDGSVSMCCATARAGFKDTCLPNGLCQNPCDASGSCGGSGQFWRETCTDQTWQSPFCLKSVCTSGNSSNDNAAMVRCAIDGSWCCGPTTSDACCASNERFSLQAILGRPSASATPSPATITAISTSTSAAATISTSTSAAATISTSTTSPTPSPSNTNSSLGTGIGIGLGLGLALIIIAAAALFFYFRRRKPSDQNDKELQYDSNWRQNHKTPFHRTFFHEVDGNTQHPTELPTQYQHRV